MGYNGNMQFQRPNRLGVNTQLKHMHYVCSRGILESCDIHSLTPVSSISHMQNYNADVATQTKPFSIYVCTTALAHFCNTTLPNIKQPFVLVTGDCDLTVVDDFPVKDHPFPVSRAFVEVFNQIINSPFLIHWYSQNCVLNNDKLLTPNESFVTGGSSALSRTDGQLCCPREVPSRQASGSPSSRTAYALVGECPLRLNRRFLTQMPIGLDYHTMSERNMHWGPQTAPDAQEHMIMEIGRSSLPTHLRQLKAYCNFQFAIHHSKYGYDRTDAINNFPTELTWYEPQPVGREHCWNTQTKYAFVLSPHGNGLDCHRTWEALCLGCIPIVKTSPLDPMYAGLPVLILRDWSECSETLLREKLAELAPLFESEICQNKLQLKYWVQMIQRDVESFNYKHNTTQMSEAISPSWENNDQKNYNAHVARGLGQICGDEFSRDIERLAADSSNRTFLEVGTWNGLGSTMAFSRGFKRRPDGSDYVFYSLECNADKCRDAQKLHANNPNIHILNEVIWNEEPANFYEIFPQCKTNAMYKHWNEVDLANMKICPVFLDKRPTNREGMVFDRADLPEIFDVLLLDGGEFTTYFEFQILKNRCRTLLLDDTNVDKCKLIVAEIKSNPDVWEIVKEVPVRNGYMIVRNRTL